MPGLNDPFLTTHTHSLTEPECIVLIAMHKYGVAMDDGKLDCLTWARIKFALRKLFAKEAGKSLWNFNIPLKEDIPTYASAFQNLVRVGFVQYIPTTQKWSHQPIWFAGNTVEHVRRWIGEVKEKNKRGTNRSAAEQ